MITDPGLARLTVPVGERDHIRGPRTAPVTLVEYGDFECPHCGRAHAILAQVLQQVGDGVRFAFRHFPLDNAHPHAMRAAEASEAAAAQGQFWEMHDTLFEHQDALDDPDLVVYASWLGLDVERFAHELASGAYSERVREDFMGGVRSGVNGTPTFFIDGVRHDGGWDGPSLLAALEANGA